MLRGRNATAIGFVKTTLLATQTIPRQIVTAAECAFEQAPKDKRIAYIDKAFKYLVATIFLIPISALVLAQGSIEGNASPCQNSTEEYKYCRSSNFPYHWSWSVTSDAIVNNLGSNQNCYFAEVKIKINSTRLTFHQRNPPGVPQVNNVTKQINPRKCEKEGSGSDAQDPENSQQ